MKRTKKATVVAQLNIDVIAEILSRLCVKDLIRFKSVCKSWLELISSKDFIKLHLQRSTSLRPIPLDNLFFDIDCHRVRTSRPEKSCFCGSSSDGLVCLFNKGQSIIHIWNPALHSSACIPMKNRPPPIIHCYWFGLHNDEYKLVLGTIELEMHAIRPYKDSSYDWKSTQKFIDGYCQFNSHEIGTLFNGTVHWPVRKRQPLGSTYWTMLSYNLHQEKVGEIALPVENMNKFVGLGEVDGCLSALISIVPKEFEIWSMKEYGLEESWTKMIIVNVNAESVVPFHGIRPKDVLDNPKSPLYHKGALGYNESLVSPKLRTERSLRSHKKSSCRIIQGACKDT